MVAASSETKTNAKGGILQRLPRLSTTVWTLIIAALFLIAMIPLTMGYLEQASKQKALKLQISQLQSQNDSLVLKMSSQSSSAEAAKLKAEAEAARAAYRDVSANPEISRTIMGLAWDNDVTITSMTVSSGKAKIQEKEYYTLNYALRVTGQVAGFQNFLRAVGKELPSSIYTSVSISPSGIEGELDQASFGIQVLCSN